MTDDMAARARRPLELDCRVATLLEHGGMRCGKRKRFRVSGEDDRA
jgi:hypothetical protein